MTEQRFTGLVASTGIAIGPAFRVENRTTGRRETGDPTQEAGDLRAAIDHAVADIVRLIAEADEDAAAILEFQSAMLEDEALAEPAFDAIEKGVAAERAWQLALDSQIADYAASEDDYFRARTADLQDIRDRVLRHLTGDEASTAPVGAIFLGEDLTPSLFMSQDWRGGGAIALSKGSPSSHVAMLARARQVPMVVGLGIDVGQVVPGTTVIVDGEAGAISVAPDFSTQAEAEQRLLQVRAGASAAEAQQFLPGRTADGTEVKVTINVAAPSEVDGLDPKICDGIGLVRTELLFSQDGKLPDEETQYRVYRHLLDWAQGRPVTIRTLDAGGDKPIRGLTIDGEGNPFLGQRGLRLSLARPDVFRVQLRALCRAAVSGNLKVMLPMVTVPRELEAARHLMEACLADLRQAGIGCAAPPLGIMVEVPSTALTPERFAADFYSIGSNDLTQYVMAAARDLDTVASLSDTGDPAVLKLIAMAAAYGREAGREVSLCGDAAADPRLVPFLLKAGLRSLSMAPAAVGLIKTAISRVDLATSEKLSSR
ncbi:MAG: phosphoenolpyruvate--protein phosphotransferase [Dongiaceae bacterium]